MNANDRKSNLVPHIMIRLLVRWIKALTSQPKGNVFKNSPSLQTYILHVQSSNTFADSMSSCINLFISEVKSID